MGIKKSILVILVSVALILSLGCINTTTSNTQSSSTPAQLTQSTPLETSSTWTPSSWVAYDKDITLNGQYYIGDVDITHTSRVAMELNLLSGANSISYLAIIQASELQAWKENSPSITYEFITRHVRSGTYMATLSPGKYYVVVGMADPVPTTLTHGVAVIKAGKYLGIPIDLNNILSAEDVKANINVREELDINVFFTTANEFNVYQEGGTPEVYTEYKKAKSGVYDLINGPPSYVTEIGPDTYYLVLDNGYSLITTKTVDYTVTADVVYPAAVHLTVKVKETG